MMTRNVCPVKLINIWFKEPIVTPAELAQMPHTALLAKTLQEFAQNARVPTF